MTFPPELFQMARRTPARLRSGIAARPALTHWVWHKARSQDAKEQLLEVISLLWTSCILTKLGLYLNLWAEDSLKGFIPYNKHWQCAILSLTSNLRSQSFCWKVLYRPVVYVLNLQLDIFLQRGKNCPKPKVACFDVSICIPRTVWNTFSVDCLLKKSDLQVWCQENG